MEKIFWIQGFRVQASRVQASSHPESKCPQSKRPGIQSQCWNAHCPCSFWYVGKTCSYSEEPPLPEQRVRKDYVFSYVGITTQVEFT